MDQSVLILVSTTRLFRIGLKDGIWPVWTSRALQDASVPANTQSLPQPTAFSQWWWLSSPWPVLWDLPGPATSPATRGLIIGEVVSLQDPAGSSFLSNWLKHIPHQCLNIFPVTSFLYWVLLLVLNTVSHILFNLWGFLRN